MFTQRVSMDCTMEQYKEHLQPELLKMGYEEEFLGLGEFDIIVNNIDGKIGKVSNLPKRCSQKRMRTYLGSFNAPLYLALAAMTNDVRLMYGEYILRKETGTLYRNNWGNQEFNYPECPKATVSEIMQKFGKNNENTNNLTKDSNMEKKDLRELLQSGRIVELRYGHTGIIIATHMGLLVQFEENWNNFANYHPNLKSTIRDAYDIVRIREIKYETQVIREELKDAPIIWERKEVKEYTLDEVLKMAGLNKAEVKVVG